MSDASGGTKKSLKPAVRVFSWTVAWGVTILLACIGAKFLKLPQVLFIVIVIVNIGVGIGAIRAHIGWINAIDEMQRKIQLEFMAMTLGILWVAFGAILIMDTVSILDVDVVIFPVLAALAMFAGTLFGVLRHR
jgi:hypothetical protein